MSWRIVPAAALGDVAALQPVAESVFGAGDRRRDWFRRKLARERIDPDLSRVAIAGGGTDVDACIGYVLVGRAPSQWPIVRTAGTAVIGAWRRRGVASALLDAAGAAAAGVGATALELWAERGREAFYGARGFGLHRRTTTLLAFARGVVGELPGPAAWGDEQHVLELHGYLAEAWEGTAAHERHTLAWPELGVVAHVCREGRAFAIHRMYAPMASTAAPHHVAFTTAFDHLLERLPSAAPVIAIALPEVSSITASLRTAGWIDVQRTSILRRSLTHWTSAAVPPMMPG